MFECWVYKDEPHVRLVVKAGSSVPSDLGHKDWKLLGPWDADADTAHEVEHRGFHYFKVDDAVAHSTFKNAEASGN